MFSRMSKTWDRKVHCIRNNVCWKIDHKKASRSESGPLFQPLPEASDDEEKVEDVHLEELWKHIFKIWKLREKVNHQKAFFCEDFPWPNVPALLDLKGILLLRSDLPIKDIHGDVKEILGRVNVATVAPLVLAHTLTLDASIDASITNREELCHLTEVMYDLTIALKTLSESPEGTQDVMQEATSLIVEGARVFALQGGRRRSASDVVAIRQKLKTMYEHIKSGPFSKALPGAFHDEASFSGSFNVSMESKGKNVDVSLNASGTPRCDEASSPGYSDLPKRSEGQDVDVNLNISAAPRCNEAPSCSSSSGPTKSRSDLISSKRKDKVEDVDLEELWKHIFELRKLREEGNHQEASFLGHFPWPDFPGLQKLKEIVSFGTDLPIEEIYGAVQAILEEIGRENVATAAPLVVAHTLERFDASITNREELWHLTEVMYDLAIALKTLSESPEGTQDVMQEATSLIVEGARVFSLQGGRRRSASEVRAIRQKLNTMYRHINTEFTVRVFTPIQHQRRSHLSKEYRTQADNGQVEEDLLLTVQQEVDINTGQVEEDLPVSELQNSYIHNNEQVEEDLLSSRRQKVFKMEALVAATNNFHKDNKVGEGGFGAVYKGTTHDGKQIAVKKMSFTSDRRSPEFLKKQFENEKLLAKVQHRNLVDLLGFCEQESQGFLVYEYLPNKSLDKFLFDPENRKLLDWHKRYNIIQGIARGLQYLHEDSRVRIVHRDIKATNILLDENLNPKIADFGNANLFPEDRTHVTATSPGGTFGYMPPDYFMTRQFSVRTDVYSFGILLLEIVTGKEISSDALKFLGWVWSSYNRKEALQTIDPTIIETWDIETRYKEAGKALRCIQVGLLCTQGDFWLRPKMSDVIAMLSTYESLPDPKNPPCLPSYCATQENGNSAMEKLMFNSE